MTDAERKEKERLRSAARRAAGKTAKHPLVVKAVKSLRKTAKKPLSSNLIVISFKGTPDHRATFQGLGGGAWLRPILDKKA